MYEIYLCHSIYQLKEPLHVERMEQNQSPLHQAFGSTVQPRQLRLKDQHKFHITKSESMKQENQFNFRFCIQNRKKPINGALVTFTLKTYYSTISW
jgi:hypothetical protein